MYELIILSLVMHGPLHGYLIAKITNDIIGPWAKISNGTLYPLLTKLERAGLIITTSDESGQQRGERQLRSFKITEQGRKRFHHLMMDTTSNPGEYQKFFHLKLSHMEFLLPSERLHLYDHYINYCQTHRFYLQSEAQDLYEVTAGQADMSSYRLEVTLDVMQHFVDQWQAEMEWTKLMREKEVGRLQAVDSGANSRQDHVPGQAQDLSLQDWTSLRSSSEGMRRLQQDNGQLNHTEQE